MVQTPYFVANQPVLYGFWGLTLQNRWFGLQTPCFAQTLSFCGGFGGCWWGQNITSHNVIVSSNFPDYVIIFYIAELVSNYFLRCVLSCVVTKHTM